MLILPVLKWSTKYPTRASPPAEDAASLQHAIVARYKLSDDPGKSVHQELVMELWCGREKLIASRQDAGFAFHCCAEPAVKAEPGESAEEVSGGDDETAARGIQRAV